LIRIRPRKIATHRALAFAHDVELRLNPWYGGARASLTDGPSLAASAAAGASPTTRVGATLHGGSRDPNGGGDGGDGNNGGAGKIGGSSVNKMKQADLLACG